jgi:ribosomal protein L37E
MNRDLSLDEWEEFLDEETCPRCGEFFENPGSPCTICGFDPLYD